MTTYSFPGYVGDVVTKTKIESTWAQAIRDRTLQVFTTVAARAAAIPSPQVGQVSILTAPASAGQEGIYQYVGATDGWTAPWNIPWGNVKLVTKTNLSQSGITALTDITSLTTGNLTTIANRLYRVAGFVEISASVNNNQTDTAVVQITDGTPTVKQRVLIGMAGDTSIPTPQPTAQPVFWETTTATATYLRKLRIGRNNGTTVTFGTFSDGTNTTAYIMVDDMGPSGSPA